MTPLEPTTATWQVRGARQDLWPTRIYQRATPTGPDTDALAEEITTREAADTSISLGVTAARKSAPDVLSWPLPAVDSLNGWIEEAVLTLTDASPRTALKVSGWAVHYRTGGFHELHAHHDSAVSGVYYLRTAADPTGALELVDPRPAHLATETAGPKAVLEVVPSSGLLIAFPSWLRHGVAPHDSTSPRLCIAFNVTMETR
ncbi:TIGR02466 family protein [Streptomyces sp. NPDC021354]|uniref:TIGR02466 family protein n=1 Tax=Streptomyces sp. NPDC021354 TaxID=3154793 RepID=UPI0033CAB12B